MNLPFSLGRILLRVRPAPLAVILKHLLGLRRRELTTPEGTFWVDPASNIGQRIWTGGNYDPESSALLGRLLKPGDTYLDIGANEGCLCVPAARIVGPAGRVIAVEPQTRLQEVLRRNFALNQCRVEILCIAVSDHAGSAELHLTPEVNNSASGLAPHTRYGLPTQSVALATLSQIFERLSLPGSVIMKMDIEGFEHEAILGSPELFRTGRIPAILLELHPPYIARRGLDPDAVPRFLSSCGYAHLPGSHGHVWASPAFCT